MEAAVALFREGATIPFIARYRKERTGALDEAELLTIRDRHQQLETLEKRRASIIASLAERDLLNAELAERLEAVETAAELEDLYLPFRPRKRTRADKAREAGLEPLARALLEEQGADPDRLAAELVADLETVESVEEALRGAQDIVAQWISEDAELRRALRSIYRRLAALEAKRSSRRADGAPKKAGSESRKTQTHKAQTHKAEVYRDYFDWREPAARAPSHRVLAALRGEREGHLVVHVRPPEEAPMAVIRRGYARGEGRRRELLEEACVDAYRRLLAPSLENERKSEIKQTADEAAAQVFAANLRELLLAPPLGQKAVLAIDPGLRTGCKLVVLDAQGTLRHQETVYPLEPRRETEKTAQRIRELVAEHGCEVIAVGNGTGGRETVAFLRGEESLAGVPVVMVSEAGASVYSASAAAREEFPDQDVTVRGAISIGRRLVDPLSELVKIDPRAIGVGQYQHDVDQKLLEQRLGDTVISCVNQVGVEVNTASPHLLRYVAGLSEATARAIVNRRAEKGPFRSRTQLLDVTGVGEKTYEQAAGFLRIRGGEHPLDASAVHPERYELVERIAADQSVDVRALLGNQQLVGRIRWKAYGGLEVGEDTLKDIARELLQPGRDPRPSFELFTFSDAVHTIEDLQVGMKLPGIVTNVTAFGAFVDIGVHRDGLVHISRLSKDFVKDPAQVVHVGQTVTATVLEVDLERKRIGLSLAD